VDTGGTWIDSSAEATVARFVVFVLLVGGGALAGWTLVDLVRRNRSRAGRAARGALGRPEPAPWAGGDWACGRCKSVNRPRARSCARCHGERATVEMRFPGVAGEPDVIPGEVHGGPGSIVMLVHDDAAHTRGLAGHWTLRVNGVSTGSAATRDGALALLRALRDTEVVVFDPKGDGYAPYALAALIAAFEGPKLPFAGPCPEGGVRRAAGPGPAAGRPPG